MIQVATAVMTISANRIVYADGSENLDFSSAGGAASVVSVSFDITRHLLGRDGDHEGGHAVLGSGTRSSNPGSRRAHAMNSTSATTTATIRTQRVVDTGSVSSGISVSVSDVHQIGSRCSGQVMQ